MEETLGKLVYPVTRRITFGYYNGSRIWFHVPGGCQEFSLKVSQTNRVTRYGAALRNSRDEIVAEKSWAWEETLRSHGLVAKVPERERGKTWSLAYHCRARMPIELDEQIPLFVSDSEEAFFWTPELTQFVARPE